MRNVLFKKLQHIKDKARTDRLLMKTLCIIRCIFNFVSTVIKLRRGVRRKLFQQAMFYLLSKIV